MTRDPLPPIDPEAAGFSRSGLDRLRAVMDRTVDDGSHAGYVALLARDGRVVEWWAHGHRDAPARVPLARDDVFRISTPAPPPSRSTCAPPARWAWA